MLTLYHGSTSVCAIKARLTLEEKGLRWKSELLNLQRGDQHRLDYVKLNPNAVVPRSCTTVARSSSTSMTRSRRRRSCRRIPASSVRIAAWFSPEDAKRFAVEPSNVQPKLERILEKAA